MEQEQEELKLIRKKRRKEIKGLFSISLVFIFFLMIFIFFISVILIKGGGIISLEFLFDGPKNAMTEGGVFPAIIGTIFITFVSALFTIPFGIASGIYLTEYSKGGRLTHYIAMAVKNLAGVPSVVYGLFGVALFLKALSLQRSVLTAGLTLGVLTLPVVITATREAIMSVPFSVRQASLGLGANKWQTISRVVVPAAMPGITTGCLLAITRAVGETAPLLFTGVAYYISAPEYGLSSQFMALSFHIFALVTQHSDPSAAIPIAYGVAFILLMMVFILSLFTVYIRHRHFRKNQ